jgi:hypothetical protein
VRVCILGYDGLEYDIVEKQNLTQIKQREYGKVKVPIVGGIDDPSTPIVWTSFITGQPPDVHGVDMPEVWDNAFDGFRSFIRKHKILHGISRRFKIGYKVRGAIGIEAKFPSRKNIKCPTLFDEIDQSIPLGIPVFNKNLSKVYPVGEVIRVRQNPSYSLNFEKKIRKLFTQEVEDLFEAIKKDWKLLMVHFHITDLFGHVFWGTEKLITLYEEMNNLTKRIKMELRKDDLVLIISDHGMSKLGHTKQGFYSFSQKLGLKDPDITDFFKILVNFLD